MERLEIHSQEEYEANKDFDGILVIKCRGLVLWENASAVLRGNASAELRENASAVAQGERQRRRSGGTPAPSRSIMRSRFCTTMRAPKK